MIKYNQRRTNVWIFRLITTILPIIFFMLFEVILRLSGYGQSLPLFISTPNSENYLLARPDIIKRYFPKNSSIPKVTIEPNLFLKHKPKNSIRLFVQGGSTAAGFPYGFGASPAGLLQQRLQRTFPHKNVEVINTAMSAVNSYTLLDFVDEIIEQKPDAVLIYTGHNEYLGILGVGSNYTAANSYAANLLFLNLKQLRLYQLIQNTYSWLITDNNTKSIKATLTDKRTMMAKVAKHKNIPLNSELYQSGLHQFKSNLNLILDKYKAANIDVFISTIASNLKDHKPFSSILLSQKSKNTIKNINLQLSNETTSNKTLSKLNKIEFEKLMNLVNHNNNADLYFELAKIYEITGQYQLAQQYFSQARDNDLLRFRAPNAFNEIIRQSANEHQVFLVEYEKHLAQSSKHGLIGKEFMLEHLHPNIQGYFILADQFYQSIKSSALFGDWKNAIDTSQAWKERPILAAEEYAGFAKIIQLKSDYPFSLTPKKVVLPKPNDWQQQLGMQYFSQNLDWLKMLNLSYQGYLKRRNIPMILKTSQMIANAMPQNADVNFRVGNQLLQNEQPLSAKRFFERALLEEPNNMKYRKALSSIK